MANTEKYNSQLIKQNNKRAVYDLEKEVRIILEKDMNGGKYAWTMTINKISGNIGVNKELTLKLKEPEKTYNTIVDILKKLADDKPFMMKGITLVYDDILFGVFKDKIERYIKRDLRSIFNIDLPTRSGDKTSIKLAIKPNNLKTTFAKDEDVLESGFRDFLKTTDLDYDNFKYTSA